MLLSAPINSVVVIILDIRNRKMPTVKLQYMEACCNKISQISVILSSNSCRYGKPITEYLSDTLFICFMWWPLREYMMLSTAM